MLASQTLFLALCFRGVTGADCSAVLQGTTANVSLDLIGTEGRLADKVLENCESDFVRGRSDVFEVVGHDVGSLTALRVRHDDSGFSPNWYLK